MKVVAIIQARMGSTRLPGKVLRALGGSTVLAHVIRRAQHAGNVDQTVVATTQLAKDDVIAHEAARLGVDVFRGSEDDVLSRYRFAALQAGADVVVRVTADCPLLDPVLLRAMVQRFLELRSGALPVDYLSNTLERTYPRGLDVEVFTRDALEIAFRDAYGPAEREHVTPYLYRHPEIFRIAQFRGAPDLSAHRWTLDTEEDWELLDGIFRRLAGKQESFGTDEVLGVLAANPGLAAVNARIAQKMVGH